MSFLCERSTLPLCPGVYGLINLCLIPRSLSFSSNKVKSFSFKSLFVNSVTLSVCTHSTFNGKALSICSMKTADEYELRFSFVVLCQFNCNTGFSYLLFFFSCFCNASIVNLHTEICAVVSKHLKSLYKICIIKKL